MGACHPGQVSDPPTTLRSKAKTGHVPCSLLGALLVCAPLYVALQYFVDVQAADLAAERETLDWTPLPGVVLHSSFKNMGRIRPDSSDRYLVHIEYEFTESGATRRGQGVDLTSKNEYMGEARAKKLVRRYPVSAPVTVYMNPDDPSQTSLNPKGAVRRDRRGLKETSRMYPMLLGFVALFVYALLMSVTRGRESPETEEQPGGPKVS
jgi:hypothetical protein